MNGKSLPKVMIITPPEMASGEDAVRTGSYVGSLYVYAMLKSYFYDTPEKQRNLDFYNAFSDDLTRGEKVKRLKVSGAAFDFGIYGVSEDELRKRIQDFEPDIVLMPSLFTLQFPAVLHVASVVKSAKPDALVALGGAHATGDYEYILGMPEFDLIFRGSSFVSFPKVMNAIINGEPVGGIQGIAYRDEDGSITNTGLGRHITQEEFEKLPPPAYYLHQKEQFPPAFVHWAGDGYNDGYFADIVSIYGCPNACQFCTDPWMHGKNAVTVPISQVKSTLDELGTRGFTVVAEMSANIGQFYFSGNEELRQYIRDLYAMLGARGSRGMRWIKDSGEYAFAMTPEYARLLRDAGCTEVQLSYENINMETMMYEERKFPVEHAVAYLERLFGEEQIEELVPASVLDYLKKALETIRRVEGNYPGVHGEFWGLSERYVQFLEDLKKAGIDFSELYYKVLEAAVEITHRLGMKTHGYTLTGLMRDGLEGVLKNLYYASRLRNEHGFGNNPQIFIKPFPGTATWKKFRDDVYPEYAWWNSPPGTVDSGSLAGILGSYTSWWLSYPVLKVWQKDDNPGRQEKKVVRREAMDAILKASQEAINGTNALVLGSSKKPPVEDVGVISIHEFARQLAGRRQQLLAYQQKNPARRAIRLVS